MATVSRKKSEERRHRMLVRVSERAYRMGVVAAKDAGVTMAEFTSGAIEAAVRATLSKSGGVR